MAADVPTRKRLIAAAADLLQTQGYSATGVSEVLERAKAPKGSMYHHFPGGKEELGAAAVDLAAQQIGSVIAKVMDNAPTPAAAVRSLGGLLAAGLEHSNYERGCPIATVTLETAATSDPLHEASARGFASWEADIARTTGADPTFILSALEGALILARARRDASCVRDVADRLAKDLETT